MKVHLIALILLCCCFKVLFAQDEKGYTLTFGQESAFLLGGLGTLAIGNLQSPEDNLLSQQEIDALDPNNIWVLDRFATKRSSLRAAHWSDAGLYAGLLCPGLLIVPQNTRSRCLSIAVVGLETALLTTGLTYLSKNTSLRTRPYMYNENSVFFINDKDSRQSFFSGHTSITTAMCFFTAFTLKEYLTPGKWSRIAWAGALIIPAFVGIMRVSAGKHFPTDVMVGYGLGAAVGYWVPKLHTNGKGKQKLSIRTGLHGLTLSYRL